MAANFTRFEVQIPLYSDGTPEADAVNVFKSSLLTLNQFVSNDAYINETDGSIRQVHLIYGLITVAQQSAALGFLNTLNASLGTNVLCTVNTVTSEP